MMVSFKGIEKFKPHLSQIIYQMTFAGMYVIARVSIVHGMNHFVFVTYRQVTATLAIAPIAYLLERKGRPPLTWLVLFQILLLSSGITITQNCSILGLFYTSSTFGSAASNVLPVLTFAMATFLRLETITISSLGGQAKILGTVISVSGAMVMTLYKGPALMFLSPGVQSHQIASSSNHNNLVLGYILIFGSLLSWAACIVFQAPVLKRYPAQLSLTTVSCLFGALQSGLIAVISEHRKFDIWAIGWNVELLGVLYSGIMCSALGMFLQLWCVSRTGPVFLVIFSPLGTIITAILELIFVHVYLRVGSVVGAIVIVVGLYIALWGKASDLRTKVGQDSENQIPIRAAPFEKEETAV